MGADGGMVGVTGAGIEHVYDIESNEEVGLVDWVVNVMLDDMRRCRRWVMVSMPLFTAMPN